jgi:hypothetical protein
MLMSLDTMSNSPIVMLNPPMIPHVIAIMIVFCLGATHGAAKNMTTIGPKRLVWRNPWKFCRYHSSSAFQALREEGRGTSRVSLPCGFDIMTMQLSEILSPSAMYYQIKFQVSLPWREPTVDYIGHNCFVGVRSFCFLPLALNSQHGCW